MELVIVIPAALGGLAAVLFAIGLANGESVTTPQADPVDAVDWATLETRFRTRIGWPEERMAAAFAEYKEFLRLARANPGKIFAPLSDDHPSPASLVLQGEVRAWRRICSWPSF